MSGSKIVNNQNFGIHKPQHQKGLIKYSNLSPYLQQIEKRKKQKLILREDKIKNKNQSSFKSFRIKQTSTTSLKNYRKTSLKSKTINQIINKINKKKKQYHNKTKHSTTQVDQIYYPTSSLSIKHQKTVDISLNENKDKPQNKYKKNHLFRKNKYQSKSRNQDNFSRNINKQTIEITKLGHTDANTSKSKKQQSHQIQQKKTQNISAHATKKFRKGKYQMLYSSVASNYQQTNQKQNKHEPSKSQNNIQVSKKQSYLSIYKDNDALAQKQMQKFYHQLRNKQIQRSLEKSTEKYFKQQNIYRLPKTNNDIQIYVSTIKAPSINRQSNASTDHTSQKQQSMFLTSINKNKSKQNNLLIYDFDFKQGQSQILGITEMSNLSQEDSVQLVQKNSFQLQRKKVQIQYFHKKISHVDWSQQDCQIDQV